MPEGNQYPPSVSQRVTEILLLLAGDYYIHLKVLSHQIFKACYACMHAYAIKSVLSAWALTVFNFFHLVVILIFEYKILMYIALNTA